jgi:hypothetical protein
MPADEELDLVEFGAWVEVELIDQTGHDEAMSFVIVGAEAADLDAGLLSEGTPLAKAILGRAVGSSAPYRLGDIERVRIVRARRMAGAPLEDTAARRQAILEKARADAERTNAEMFASSYSGKWGDYHPEDMDQWEQA